MNRKMIELAYGDAASSVETAPVAGKRTSGRRDVAGIGTGSVTHHVATQAVVAATACPAYVRPSGEGAARTATNRSGPRGRPTLALMP
jgi:hypothetical protein